MSAGQARRSLKQFIIGKACSAVLTFSLLLLVARLLPTADYGAYLTVFAAVEFCGSIALLGYDWMIYRYLPEIRLHATEVQQRQFLRKTLSRHACSLLVFALLLPTTLYFWQSHLSLNLSTPLLIVCGAWLFLEHGARLVRDGVFSSLLMQGWSQGLAALRSGLMLLFVLLVAYLSALSLHVIILLEFFTAIIIFAVSQWRLWFRPWLCFVNTCDENYLFPQWDSMRKLGWHNYWAAQLALLQGPQVLTILANFFFGLTGAALYGFARNLTEQVRKYLPSEILMGVLRPILLNRFSLHKNEVALGSDISVLYRLSVCVLVFIFVPLLVDGSAFVSFIGGKNLEAASPLLFIMVLGLLAFSHRRFLELYCNAVGASDLWLKASFRAVVLFPIMLVLLPFVGLIGLAIYTLLAEVLVNLFLVRGIYRRGFSYRSPVNLLLKFLVSGVLSVLIAFTMKAYLGYFSVLIGCFVWFSLLYLFRYCTRADFLYLRTMFSKK